MEVFYAPRASDDLERLPRAVQVRIAAKMRWFATQGNPLRFAEHLTDYRDGEYRFRTGAYRATFDVDGIVINILRIRHRLEVYR